jgi:type II restriction enzyme
VTTPAEASELLRSVGLPPAQCNEISALTLLTLGGLTRQTSWNSARPKVLRIHDIKEAIKADWGRDYAENTRETIRRFVIHQFIEAGLVARNPDHPELPTNDPRTRYALTPEALSCVKAWTGPDSSRAISDFKRRYGSLSVRSRKERSSHTVRVEMPEGTSVVLSPGAHNEVQRAVIEQFVPRFVRSGRVLYLGDTARKDTLVDRTRLGKLGLDLPEHGKLPDIIVHQEDRGWLVLIEAVTSHGPVTPVREIQLRRMFEGPNRQLILVTAFPNRAEFRRHVADIAWETEVWIADEPDHLVHFNGEKFLGAYPSSG